MYLRSGILVVDSVLLYNADSIIVVSWSMAGATQPSQHPLSSVTMQTSVLSSSRPAGRLASRLLRTGIPQ